MFIEGKSEYSGMKSSEASVGIASNKYNKNLYDCGF